MSGVLYCGDNLEVLRQCVPEESVDLVYLDPPFNSQRTYNITYKGSQAQEEAFKDHWSWEEAAPEYAKLLESSETPPRLRTLLRGLNDLLIADDSDLLAYLVMMAPRLFRLHRVLKATGSLFLHCDLTASHYLKLLLDSVFGPHRLINEIIWQRSTGKSLSSRRLPNNHDVILAYAKSDDYVWNESEAFVPYDPENLDEKTAGKYSHTEADGRIYRLDNLINPNPDRPNLTYEFLGVTRVWRWTQERMREAHAKGLVVQSAPGRVPQLKRYLDEQRGRPIGDVWSDIPPLNSQAAERLGYPTQKPLALLTRLVRIMSPPGGLVLDPFCGCGTTIEACEEDRRRWIGIDIAQKAVELAEFRFKKRDWPMPEVRYFPPDMDAAKALCARRGGGQQFESWILRKLQAVKPKRDRGIDGEAHFRQDGKLTRVLLSVKSGKLKPEFVRDLRGTMEREHVPIGVLVTMQEPSKEMKLEAARAGYLSGGEIPRLQLLTVEEIFKGTGRIHAPGENVTAMPPPAVPQRTPDHPQLQLPLDPPKAPKKATKVATGPAVAKSPSARPAAAPATAKRRRA